MWKNECRSIDLPSRARSHPNGLALKKGDNQHLDDEMEMSGSERGETHVSEWTELEPQNVFVQGNLPPTHASDKGILT